MARAEMSIGIGETKYEGKTKFTVVSKDKEVSNVVASSTAIHEAKHAVIALKRGRKVRLATIIPGPGYNGMVQLDAHDSVAAAAPHATGCSGGSFDLSTIEATGNSVAAASAAARPMVAENEESIHATAKLIQAHGSVTGDQIAKVIDLTERKRVEVIVSDEGKEEKFDEVAAKDGIVIFSNKWTRTSTEESNEDIAA